MKFCSCLFHIAAAIQVASKLDNVTVKLDGTDVEFHSSCRYVVIGVSLVVSFAISLVQCLTCNLCGLGKFLDMIFAGVGFVWWLIAAGVVQHNVNDAPGLDGSMQDYRNATVGMMWAEVALFGVLIVSGLFRLCSCFSG
ncbi:hypothetical protein N2152v2_001479 [Parachlorella kessleri]